MSLFNFLFFTLSTFTIIVGTGVFGKNNRHGDNDEDLSFGRVKFEINFNGYDGNTCDLQTFVELDSCDEYAITAFERGCTQLGINFNAEYFASLSGYFINSINGLSADFANNLYWFLYINGNFSNFGISALPIVESDVVTWSYEPYTP